MKVPLAVPSLAEKLKRTVKLDHQPGSRPKLSAVLVGGYCRGSGM
jgi:hypothetical protein